MSHKLWSLLISVSIVLVMGCKVTGTIGEDGYPLQGVTVTISGDATRTVVTKSDGTFSFNNLAAGTYTITPSTEEGYTFDPTSRNVVKNSANEDITGIDFEVVSNELATFDTEFTLPSGLFSQSATKLTFKNLQAGDELYLVVHNMIPRATGLNDPENSFEAWAGDNLTELTGEAESSPVVAENYTPVPRIFPTDANLTDPFDSSLLWSPSNDPVAEKDTMQKTLFAGGTPEYDYGEGPEDYVIGEKQELYWVHRNIPDLDMIQITATLRAIGDNTTTGDTPTGESGAYAYIFVDDQEWDNGNINLEVVQAFADKFNGEDGIYANMTGLIGQEWGGGPEGQGGIDQNKNIYILLHDIRDGFDGTGGFVGGYYYAVNDMGRNIIYDLLGVRSNAKQMVVLDTYPAIYFEGERNLTRPISILIHEFQHMINFNQKTGLDGDWGENYENPPVGIEVWLNEACSMLCEDIFRGFIDDSESHVYNGRIPYYLMNLSWPLTHWASISEMDDALKGYATAYSFLAYLTRNVSPLILTEIIIGAGHKFSGLDAVALAIEALGETDDITTIIKRWREATIHNDPETRWMGYIDAADGGYTLDSLDLIDILMANPNYTETIPNYESFSHEAQTLNVGTGYATEILAGKVVADGDVSLYVKNGIGIDHLIYKVIKK